MGELIPIRAVGNVAKRPPIDTNHSRRQHAIKRIARNEDIKTLMKELVEDKAGIDRKTTILNEDTYSNMRDHAKQLKQAKDIEPSDVIISDGLFLTHFHALQAIHGEVQDSWELDIAATAAWPQPLAEERIHGEA
jgi:hypothetical protein